MKNLIALFLLLVGFSANAQSVATINEHEDPSASADKIAFNPETNIYEFEGNVSFKNDRISLKGADKVVLNSKTNVITATGGSRMVSSIDGSIIYGDKCTPVHTLYHKLGSKKLFVNKDCQ